MSNLTKNLKKKIIFFLLFFIVSYYKIKKNDATGYEGIHRIGESMKKYSLHDLSFLLFFAVVLFAGLLCGCGKEQTAVLVTAQATVSGTSAHPDERENGQLKTDGAKKQEAENRKVAGKVYIWGEVKNPGVYEFVPDARIGDIVEMAGGLTKKAAPGCVNLAACVSDGEEIHVYDTSQWNNMEKGGQTENGGTGSRTGAGTDSRDTGGTRVNLNTATKEELMTIPGIGEAKAEAILNFRTQQGNFSKIEDIMNISGIKEKMFQKIKDYITV